MKTGLHTKVAVICTMAAIAAVGCDKQDGSPTPADRAPPKASSAGPTDASPTIQTTKTPTAEHGSPGQHEAVRSAEPAPAPPTEVKLALEGLTMTVPDGWKVSAPAKPGAMAPKVIYVLPRAEGDDSDGTVRVTHFPNMKGMNEANIDRWVGQVRRPDGTPSTRDDANVSKLDVGSVGLTIVDVTGTINALMGHAGGGEEGQRMIVAIIDHPQGPHFIKALGGAATIEKWHESIQAFLKSATPD